MAAPGTSSSSASASASVEHAQALIRCPSVTPVEGGAIAYIAQWAKALGGCAERIDRNGVPNLFVKFGPRGASNGRHFAFAGHTDVVPIDGQDWSSDPFAPEVRDGRMFGRGTCDMKGFCALALSLVPEMQRLRRPIHFAFSYYYFPILKFLLLLQIHKS